MHSLCGLGASAVNILAGLRWNLAGTGGWHNNFVLDGDGALLYDYPDSM